MQPNIIEIHTTHTDAPGRQRLCSLPEFAGFPTLGFTPPDTDTAGVTRKTCKTCIEISAILRNRDAEARRKRDTKQTATAEQERLF